MPLFPGPIDSWNVLQQQLVTWCAFYDNVRKMDEPPADYVLEDDMELDRYLRNKQFEANQQRKQMKLDAAKRTPSKHEREVFK